MSIEKFEKILLILQDEANLTVDRSEHEAIAECSAGSLQLFKLGYSKNDTGTFLFVSFHLELDSVDAIQWYLRLRQLEEGIGLAPCYVVDSEGVTFTGEDAEIMRMYMVEQDVIATFMASNLDADEVLNAKMPTHPPSPIKVYSDLRRAHKKFAKMSKKKNDVSH